MILLESTQPVSRFGGWLRTALLGAAGIAILVLGFFFLAIAVVTGAVLAGVIALRWWWVMRRVREQARRTAPLEGEYQIIERRQGRWKD